MDLVKLLNDPTVFVEFVRILPPCGLLLLVIFFVLRFQRPIAELLSRIGGFKAFGLEAQFVQALNQINLASKGYGFTDVPKEQLDSVIKRAERMRDVLHGARILWVDDTPWANANLHRFLNVFGVTVDNTTDTDQALAALQWSADAYEVVVSDMVRPGDNRAGITLIERIAELKTRKELKAERPVILFLYRFDPSLGTPPGAYRITGNPIELLHHIMSAIDQQAKPPN